MMIKRLQKLKARRGFTMIELIVVVAIIAVMSATVIVGLSTSKSKIEEANTAASDFYNAIQAEFTNFQMFDGPLTMTLNKAYSNISLIGKNSDNGGIKYYPAVGGNYPFAGKIDSGETHASGKPKNAAVYIEICARGGMLRHVNYANDIKALLTMKGAVGSGNTGAQLCQVLANEMKDRLEYRDGYYYARISYDAPDYYVGSSEYDYRNVSVKVNWAAFSKDELTEDEDSYTFGKQNIALDGHVVGVHADAEHQNLGGVNAGVATRLW